MAQSLSVEVEVDAAGRVPVPARVLEALRVRPGDRVRFVVDDRGARLVSTQSLLDEVWATKGRRVAAAVDLSAEPQVQAQLADSAPPES